jgi:hypothetical protein
VGSARTVGLLDAQIAALEIIDRERPGTTDPKA